MKPKNHMLTAKQGGVEIKFNRVVAFRQRRTFVSNSNPLPQCHDAVESLAQRDGSLGDVTVDEIYEREPLTASPELEVMDLRRVMLERHARYVPVMDGGTLLGVVSFHDVAKAVYEDQSFENRMLQSYISS